MIGISKDVSVCWELKLEEQVWVEEQEMCFPVGALAFKHLLLVR